MAEPEDTNKRQSLDYEQRGISDVTQVAVDAATIYGIYKATHPPKPKDPPKDK